MSNNPTDIFKIFRLPTAAIVALALGIPLTFMVTTIVFQYWGIRIQDLPDAVYLFVLPVILVGSIAWATSLINITINIFNFLIGYYHKFRHENCERSRALMYLTDKTTLSVLHIGLLLSQKRKGTKIFQADTVGPADELFEKGILIRKKYVNAIFTEYEVPNFIWRHSMLENFPNHDHMIRVYHDWEKKRIKGDRL